MVIQKTRFEHVYFVKIGGFADTSRWACRTGDMPLGVVRWHDTQYCYFPQGDTVLSAGCLNDIRTFLKELNVEHYAKAAAAPSSCPQKGGSK